MHQLTYLLYHPDDQKALHICLLPNSCSKFHIQACLGIIRAYNIVMHSFDVILNIQSLHMHTVEAYVTWYCSSIM